MCLALGLSTEGLCAQPHANKHAVSDNFRPFEYLRGVGCIACLSDILLRWPPSFIMLADLMPKHLTYRNAVQGPIRNVSWLCETVRYPIWRLTPHSIDTLFSTTMSDSIDPREKPLKRKFEELPDQVTSADHPRNKRYGGLRLEFMISCYQININPSSAPPILITLSSTISAVDIAMAVSSKLHFNLPSPTWALIAHQIKFPGDQVDVSGGGVLDCSQQVLPISSGLHSPQTSIIHHW